MPGAGVQVLSVTFTPTDAADYNPAERHDDDQRLEGAPRPSWPAATASVTAARSRSLSYAIAGFVNGDAPAW